MRREHRSGRAGLDYESSSDGGLPVAVLMEGPSRAGDSLAQKEGEKLIYRTRDMCHSHSSHTLTIVLVFSCPESGSAIPERVLRPVCAGGVVARLLHETLRAPRQSSAGPTSACRTARGSSSLRQQPHDQKGRRRASEMGDQKSSA
jgi:hypothetical protein